MTVSAETIFLGDNGKTETVIRFSEADGYIEIQQSVLGGKKVEKGRSIRINNRNMTAAEALSFVESLTEAVSFVFAIPEQETEEKGAEDA